MILPSQSAERILGALNSKSLLEETAAKDVVDALEKEKVLNWNLILAKQFKSEEGGSNETEH
jgi:hypothetical protein